MPLYLVYPIYTAALGLVLIAVVPRAEIRKQAIYAIIFGGVGSVIMLALYSTLFNAVEWLHYEPFGYGGIPFFSPLAWTSYFIIYFYLLPRSAPWLHLFVLFAAAYSTLFSNVLMNLGIFSWNKGRIFLPCFIYLSWFSLITWLYLRLRKAED